MQNLQVYDFCFANRDTFYKKPSNIMDLFDRSAWKKLLALCREQISFEIENASDYELFRTICALESDLQGHTLLKRSEFLLQDRLGISEPLSLEYCDEIWKRSADHFLRQSQSLGEMDINNIECNICCVFDENDLPEALPKKIVPVLQGNCLCQTQALTWGSWKSEMSDTLTTFQKKGCRAIYFALPEEYLDIDTNLYSVEQALKNPTNDNRENLLLSQAFRFFSEYTKENCLTMILRVHTTAKETQKLLKRTLRTVGFADTVCLAPDLQTHLSLLRMITELSEPALKCGICTDDHCSDLELELAISATVSRYPKGLLQLFSGTDLRSSAFERNRLEMLQKKI